ncbi:hypothetical protein [Oceanobacter mangrovi]|uniref:hypothetical protein n=1 Tax=Oceanobacter mangrovi TaxID=2862510 RepID=UPI001C8E357E|nr:hypothetical protein [Oceanobacter mangrovi]
MLDNTQNEIEYLYGLDSLSVDNLIDKTIYRVGRNNKYWFWINYKSFPDRVLTISSEGFSMQGVIDMINGGYNANEL